VEQLQDNQGELTSKVQRLRRERDIIILISAHFALMPWSRGTRQRRLPPSGVCRKGLTVVN
jgi:hypothetical protein